ncbi:MAG: hypothetical protein PHX08_02795 [Lachnospiraceae bacterium]|nr:hypothetical protein [Lachnospiraceae bacterium]
MVLNVKEELLAQINSYLSNEITKEAYYTIAEAYFTKHAQYIKNTAFYYEYINVIPDACLIFIDEPGLSSQEKEKQFRLALEMVYVRLKDL